METQTADDFSLADYVWMKHALQLAEQGRPHPNPYVGAVIVNNGLVVGEGFHPQKGQPHAEAFALENAGARSVGGTLYVTLEPCSHRDNGRIPCTDRCIAGGIKTVVAAMEDPDSRVSGQGFAELRANGIAVQVGLLEDEARKMNRAYIKHRTTGLPYITHKAAMTLDGKIASVSGDSQWVSGEDSRNYVHELRHKTDAIVVGVGTVLADDPYLTTRRADGNGHDALRVIIDSGLRTPTMAHIAKAGSLFIATEAAHSTKRAALTDCGAEVAIVESDGAGRVDVRAAAKLLAARGCLAVLLESGGKLAASFWAVGLVDAVCYFVAPKLIGGSRSPTPIDGDGLGARMREAVSLKELRAQIMGSDILLEGEVR